MESGSKVRFFLIVIVIILAAVMPSVAIAAFGTVGGLILCFYAILQICCILAPSRGDKSTDKKLK